MTRRVVIALLAVLPGCASCDQVPADALTSCQSTQILPTSVQTDILFVVDDSGSMANKQQNLADNLSAFIDTLAASPVQNEFRIGVTNSSVNEYDGGTSYTAGPSSGDPYPAGALVAVQIDGGVPISGAYVYDAGWAGNRILDKGSPTLVADFEANVRVGTNGSGKEQPFRAARLALTDRLNDFNKGFLRDGARLAVVILSDEDDCSDTVAPFANSDTDCHSQAVKNANPPILDTVADFQAFLQGPIDGQIRDVAVGLIAGLDPATLAPSCGTCPNNSCRAAFDSGDRYAALGLSMGPLQAQMGSICDTSFHDSLTRFATALTPNSVPLSGAPADWRMLAVKITKPDKTTVGCTVGLEGASNQATVDAIYSGPTAGRPAKLTFQNACKLDLGDQVDVHVVCAG